MPNENQNLNNIPEPTTKIPKTRAKPDKTKLLNRAKAHMHFNAISNTKDFAQVSIAHSARQRYGTGSAYEPVTDITIPINPDKHTGYKYRATLRFIKATSGSARQKLEKKAKQA